MINFLEDKLYEKTKGSQSEILFAQWNYDKKVIPAALQSVSNLFPHYSLHDESHSITIINNIVRVFGCENIEKLSAIDIWLILEASYSHDIGMVVSSEDMIDALSSSVFLNYFEELVINKKESLHEFANQFEIVDGQIKYKYNVLNISLHDGIKFILAEFFRRIHSDRSKDIINNPHAKLSLSSPRGVIPQRIFKILGDICASHTRNFSDVMALPFSEVGIDIEDAHPRFIACMLRIGDLLDLDNNRFSDVMLRTLTKVPVDTLNHKAKHLSIESFRVDREVVEVRARCKDYDTANITQHWFNYLNSEISQQMINWNTIVPSKELGYLPTIGSLKVELEDYEYIDGKNKPKFTVDTDKALELLKGAGLYEGAYQCIREILQNSVDATLIRIWLEHKDSINFDSPQSKDYIELAGKYPITVNISKKNVIDDWTYWTIEISDRGIGISGQDLQFLMNTGSSSKNKKRTQIIESMPLWLRPSGTFGIGFQSIFMLTDLVKITTKSFFNEEYQIIELNSPNSPKDGDILVQKKKTTHVEKPGTVISIEHKTRTIPERWSINGEHRNATRIAHDYDPFTHESLDIELGKILDEVLEFANKSTIPINLTIDNMPISIQSEDVKKFNYFDPENALEINIKAGIGKWRNNTYYKNQLVKNNRTLDFLGIEANIHKDKASIVLKLNRNEILPEYSEVLINQILYSTFKISIEHFDEIYKNEIEKMVGSMFLNYYSTSDSVKNFDISKYDQWKKYKINVGTQEIELDQLIKSIDSLCIQYDDRFNGTISDTFVLNGRDLIITIRGRMASSNSTEFFLSKATKLFTSIRKIEHSEQNLTEVRYSNDDQNGFVTKVDLKKILFSKSNWYSFSSRMIIPTIEEYVTLRIKEGAHEPYVHIYRFDSYWNFPFPKMLSPYVTQENSKGVREIRLSLNDKVYNWVYANRYDSKTTLEEIKLSYDKFIKEFDIDQIEQTKSE